MIGILVNHQLVIGQSIPRPVVRVRGHHRHPEAPLVVKRHLDRVFEQRKFRFRSEQLDLKSIRQFHVANGFLPILIRACPHGSSGLEVGRHLGERMRARVINSEGLGFTCGNVVNQRISKRCHFASFFHLIGIILRSIGIVTLPVRVHAVDKVVVVVPEPVFLFHRRVYRSGIRL